MKRLITALATLALLLPGALANAAPPWPDACVEATLAVPAPQLVLTCVPEAWNGQLVVYAHGYVPPQEPLALPLSELTVVQPDGTPTTVPHILLALGYAFATTSYHKNGYAVEQAGADLNALVAHFRATNPATTRVKLVGASEGGLITTMLVERFPDTYAGGLALCGPLGGMQQQIKYLGDFRVVFDYFFPGLLPIPFGKPDPVPAPWEVLAPLVAGSLAANPAATEQLFKVTKAARDAADLPGSTLTTALSVLAYSVQGKNDLLATANGQPYDNRLTWFWGSNNDFALNLHLERVASDATGRAYVQQYYQPTGRLQRPLVTMHTTGDGLVPFGHEMVYLTRAFRAGSAAQVTLLPVPRYGHCTFTLAELLGAFGLLELKSGGVSTAFHDYLLQLTAQ